MEIDWDSKVLSSLTPVIENSEHVIINYDEIKNVARWMAYEEFTLPENNKLRKKTIVLPVNPCNKVAIVWGW